MSTRKIHAALMTQNELTDLIPNIERVLPYVDSVTIVDGGSTDLTVSYMRNWCAEEPKLRFFIHPWQDDFPAQRNNYLKRVAEVAEEGDWLATFDPDEYYAVETLEKLHKAADRAEELGQNMVGFQCRGVTVRGAERVHENLDDYWKQLFIKWDPNFHYTGFKCHEGKGGIPHNIMNTNLIYEHIKQANVIWLRGFRNLFVGGGGPNLGAKNHRWLELRKVCSALGLEDWHSFNKYLLAGNVDQSVKEWLIEHHDTDGFDGASEHREAALTYFVVYHPEECAVLSEELQEYFYSKGARW